MPRRVKVAVLQGPRETTGTVAQRRRLAMGGSISSAPVELLQDSSAGDIISTPQGPTDVELDILQFDAAIYYVEERQKNLVVDVVRLGRMQGRCSVKWTTEDGCGRAGDRYEAGSGELVFEPGEVVKSFEVVIIDTDLWITTLEFKLRLSEPVNCELGRYLFVSRVKVIDNSVFPSNSLAAEVEQYGAGNLAEHGVSDVELLYEYMKLNYARDDIAWKSWATLLVDLLGNLYYLLTIYLLKYVADDVLGPNSQAPLLVPGDRQLTLVLVGALYLVPYGLLNLLDLWKAQLGIAESSREFLQANIFTRFLNYDEDTRSNVRGSEMGMTMVQDANDIVDCGYMKVFEVAKNIGRFAVSSYFILGENPDAAGPLAFTAFALAIFILLNYRHNVEVSEEISERQASIMEVVQETSQKYRLIADYYMRPQAQATLKHSIDNLNEATKPLKVIEVTNSYVPGWLSVVLVAFYLSIGGEAVVQGEIQIGAFLATVNAVKDVGESFKDIFIALLDAGKAIGPIHKITELLNLPTNFADKGNSASKLRDITRQERRPERLKELREKYRQRFGTDCIELQLKDLTFQYEGESEPVLDRVNLSVPQGVCVAVVGHRRRGKTTLMRLLGQVLMPTSGVFFAPSYLRILHVSEQPMLLNDTIWKNFAFGRIYWRDNALETARALRICKRLGFDRRFMDHLHESLERFVAGIEDPKDLEWQQRLSHSDKSLVTIARALIYNPEVLVMNRPTSELSEDSASKVFELLQEFVRNRGVELPPEEAPKRRPRTAFVSFVRMSGVRIADRVWSVESPKVVEVGKREFAKDELE